MFQQECLDFFVTYGDYNRFTIGIQNIFLFWCFSLTRGAGKGG